MISPDLYFETRGGKFTDQIALAAGKMRAELALIESKLMTKKYLAGERLSAADLIIYPIIMQLNRSAASDRDDTHALAIYPLAQYFPRIADWASRMEKIPGYTNAYPPHWKPEKRLN